MSGVMTLMGIMPPLLGRVVLSRLHVRARQAPVIMVPGSSVLCEDYASVIRAMCGTARPMKAMGPQ